MMTSPSRPATPQRPDQVRAAARAGRLRAPTAGLAPGYVQANLVVLPSELAGDFARFCERNPRPCPLLETTEPGAPEPKLTAPGADLRTDLPRYRVYRHGELVEERDEIVALWRDDLVAFLLGCSFTFEEPLRAAGVPLRHLDAGRNVPMYRTSLPCAPAGIFHGPLVVSLRPIPAALVETARRVTARFPAVHGAPVHAGPPEEIGIGDLGRPDWGDPPHIEPGDVPVFWACGVTPQAAAMAVRPALMITHAPGHMFVTDLTIDALADR